MKKFIYNTVIYCKRRLADAYVRYETEPSEGMWKIFA